MSSTLTLKEHLNTLKSFSRHAYYRVRNPTISQDVLLFLIAFRILNAFSIKTFFQPDEFFQSLEPAWEIAFGAESGAWITWEWKNQLRSAVYPTSFASVYWLSSRLSKFLRLSPDAHAEVLIAAPKATQAIFAAVGDYYTWKLGAKVYGEGSNEAWAALAMTVCSPWQWFCSTRTLSNCLETTYTIVALESWPWQWSLAWRDREAADKEGLQKGDSTVFANEVSKLNRSLILAAWACIFRPTNILIWICVACFTLFQPQKPRQPVQPRLAGIFTVTEEKRALLRRTAVCGSLVLVSSAIADRRYYQEWTFPPYRFLYFNIAQSLAVFYGRNDWHYYLTQGYPLLLTTFLPFGIIGLYRSLFPAKHSSLPSTPLRISNTIKFQLGAIAVLAPLTLSFISHKEVRFIYPLLPPLHILAASPFIAFFSPAISRNPTRSHTPHLKRALLVLLLTTNLALSLFLTTSYQTAPVSVLSYLRSQYTTHHLTPPPSSSSNLAATAISPPDTMTVGFLMPCHSTPWRSRLIHPGIKAWALTCEPPLSTPSSERAAYLDEADRFYLSPRAFLREKLGDPPLPAADHEDAHAESARNVDWDGEVGDSGTVGWPQYLVFFGQLERTMKEVVGEEGGGYGECWRGWNGIGGWHEDWRRMGGMVVWCLRREEWIGVGVEKKGGKGDGGRGEL